SRTRCSALRSGRRSTCSLSQHRASRHSPTDTAVISALQDGIDGHRTLGDKVGLAGKRDMGQEEDIRTGLSISYTQILHYVLVEMSLQLSEENSDSHKNCF
ncbi:hypothetical protein CHARACLAT_028936, partial [Characodon lateralis]|nr:hypothetical protein [Characodon lateralis]